MNHQATYPSTAPNHALKARESSVPAFPADALSRKALEARKQRQAEWQAIASNPTTRLRQSWADAAWMRAHLRAANARVGDDNEPASVKRLRRKLSQSGVSVAEAHEAVGLSLCKYLRVNTRLPLWAALALILEATGRFTTQAQAIVNGGTLQ